ncbi:hypothetical protein [Halochromatium salexigens]|uniref:Uncharacterized protein n=1 Tax=Halochromatium salexigens TaxID=49447 RepID=A0AAJ0UEG9_HALSE|nr:hypothetical protein [Halochromatium salexigens]MBK5929435.1 hypothetical protein [Halochromatium salexigens]
MPYFVYKITPNMRLTHIETQERYQDARAIVRNLRAERDEADDADYRMIFAKHQLEAERLLSRPKDNRVIGED